MDIQLGNADELKWLKEGSVNATPEGKSTNDMEYWRTMCSIILLEYVLKNDYLAFVAVQPMDLRLSENSFKEIREFVTSVLRTPEDVEAMKAYLIINDLGKVKDFVEKIKEIESVNHDRILYEGLKNHSELSPTFSSLSKEYQELILEGLKTNFNMGQFVRGECLPVDLKPLKNTKKRAFDFYMVHVLFDIAGAKGHVHHTSSAICTEMYWKRFSWALSAIGNMVEHAVLADVAYNEYLKMTMKYFKLVSSTNRPVDYCVARLYNLFDAATVEDAKTIEKVFWNNTPGNNGEILCKELLKTGEYGHDLGILMYYLPSLLQNALEAYQKKYNKEEAYKRVFNEIVPRVCEIYRAVRFIADHGQTGELVVFVADVARAARDPEAFLKASLSFIRVGDDIEVTIGENPKACLIIRAQTKED